MYEVRRKQEMKEFDVEIEETLSKTITVRAESKEQALSLVKGSWKNSDIILDSEDYVGVDFKVKEERDLSHELLNILLVEPMKHPKAIQIPVGYEALRDIVGGPIEFTYPFDEETGIILNEEGKITGLEPNRGMRTENGELYDIYYGSFIVVGLTEDSICSLTPEQMEKYEKFFYHPEMFVKMGQRIITIPFEEDLSQKKCKEQIIKRNVDKSRNEI